MVDEAAKVVGCLVYEGLLRAKNGNTLTWAAEIERSPSGYQLFIKVGEAERVNSGNFTTGDAVVKYLRRAAEDKFGRAAVPVLDTLGAVVKMKAGKAVPTCYLEVPEGSGAAGGRGLDMCPSCPYSSICGTPGVESNQPKVVHMREPDDVLMARLRAKLGEAS